MRVLLISTAHPLEENPLPPMSLGYLAGALQADGFDVDILDFLITSYRPEKIRQKLEEYRPQLVGVTCVTMTYPLAAEMLKVCKETDPDLVTLIGGPHVSFAIDDALLNAPWIDAVVVGEGDDTIVEFARLVDGGGNMADIAGLAFVRDGTVVKTSPRPLIGDIDRLPAPARHLLPLARYRALGTPCTVISSRGCPYGCLFCSAHRMFGRKVRFRDPGLVVDEIERIVRDFGFEQINIVDDTFTVNHQHARGICEEMLRRNLKVNWCAYARADNMTDELVALMKRAGCNMMLFGLESADESILKTIGKGIRPDDMRNGVRIATSAGMKVFGSFIIGLPGESQETIETTRRFAEEINVGYGAQYGYHILSPLPGTDLYENAADYGLRILSQNWADFDANQVIVESSTMTPDMTRAAMAYYEELIEHAWEDIERWAASGDPESIQRLDQKASRGFVWSVLQGDVIEAAGPVSADAGLTRTAAEAELASRVGARLGKPLDLVQPQLARLHDENLLQLAPADGGPCWRWSDNQHLASPGAAAAP